MEQRGGRFLPDFSLTHVTCSPRETFRLGCQLGGALLPEGGLLALVGELGGGKTTFTKGLAAGLLVTDHSRVTSPTFVLRQEYRGRIPLCHYDAYRLSGALEFQMLGFQEDLDSGSLVVVEWADRVSSALSADALTVEFEHQGRGDRVSGTSPESSAGETQKDSGCRRITFRGDRDRWAKPVERAVNECRSPTVDG